MALMGCNPLIKQCQQAKVKISESLLQPCEQAELLESDTMQELADKLVLNSQRLNKCSDSKNALIEQVRKIEYNTSNGK